MLPRRYWAVLSNPFGLATLARRTPRCEPVLDVSRGELLNNAVGNFLYELLVRLVELLCQAPCELLDERVGSVVSVEGRRLRLTGDLAPSCVHLACENPDELIFGESFEGSLSPKSLCIPLTDRAALFYFQYGHVAFSVLPLTKERIRFRPMRNAIRSRSGYGERHDRLPPVRHGLVADLVRPHLKLVAENALLRQQLIVSERRIVGRQRWAPWERYAMALAARFTPTWGP